MHPVAQWRGVGIWASAEGYERLPPQRSTHAKGAWSFLTHRDSTSSYQRESTKLEQSLWKTPNYSYQLWRKLGHFPINSIGAPQHSSTLFDRFFLRWMACLLQSGSLGPEGAWTDPFAHLKTTLASNRPLEIICPQSHTTSSRLWWAEWKRRSVAECDHRCEPAARRYF